MAATMCGVHPLIDNAYPDTFRQHKINDNGTHMHTLVTRANESPICVAHAPTSAPLCRRITPAPYEAGTYIPKATNSFDNGQNSSSFRHRLLYIERNRSTMSTTVRHSAELPGIRFDQFVIH